MFLSANFEKFFNSISGFFLGEKYRFLQCVHSSIETVGKGFYLDGIFNVGVLFSYITRSSESEVGC